MFLTVAAKGFSAWLTVITYCGTPVFITGMDNGGKFVAGQYQYILEDGRASRTFATITSQLPRDKKGEPVINQVKIEKQLDLFCPVSA